MREVAKYSFAVEFPSIDNANRAWLATLKATLDWLEGKGATRHSEQAQSVVLPDGREALLSRSEIGFDDCLLNTWVFREPTTAIQGSSVFQTTLSASKMHKRLAVACVLEVGNPQSHVAPVFFDAFCPRIVRDIIDLDYGWVVSGTKAFTRPQQYTSEQNATELWREISDDRRALPIILVSEQSGLCLHPQLAPRLARDLAGLAVVAHVTDAVSWALTHELGEEWSCYNGAVRIYWPFAGAEQNPYSHPLWTPQRMLQGVFTAEQAANRIRSQIRRKIMGLSALTIYEDQQFSEVQELHRQHLQEAKRKEAKNSEQWVAMLEAENMALAGDNRTLKAQVAKLKSDLSRVGFRQDWSVPAEEDVAPDTEKVLTVVEAVKKAKAIWKDYIVFGDDVMRGASEVNNDKVPVDKVCAYLEGLSKLAKAKQKGSLGRSDIVWLKEIGITASPESETIKKSSESMRRRTWHDGKKRRKFEYHLKPTDAVHPDACVRIYFEWEPLENKIIVGWVGRHPD